MTRNQTSSVYELENICDNDYKEYILESAKYVGVSMADNEFYKVVNNYKYSEWYKKYNESWGVEDCFNDYLEWVKVFNYYHLVICKYNNMKDAMNHLRHDYQILTDPMLWNNKILVKKIIDAYYDMDE